MAEEEEKAATSSGDSSPPVATAAPARADLFLQDKCLVCQTKHLSRVAKEKHLDTVGHKEKVLIYDFLGHLPSKTFDEGNSIILENCKEKFGAKPVVGLECVYELHFMDTTDILWACSLCYVAGNTLIDLDEHIQSNSHRKSYLDEYHPDIALLSRTPRDQSVELDQICSRITSGATKELESPQVVPFPEEKCYGTVATELGIELASETEQFHDVSYDAESVVENVWRPFQSAATAQKPKWTIADQKKTNKKSGTEMRTQNICDVGVAELIEDADRNVMICTICQLTLPMDDQSAISGHVRDEKHLLNYLKTADPVLRERLNRIADREMVRAELLSFLANKMPILIAGDTSPKLCDRNLCFTVQQWPALSFKVFQDLFTSHPEFKSNMLISRLEEQFSAFECPEEGEIALCNALQALGIRLISIRSDTMGFWCMTCRHTFFILNGQISNIFWVKHLCEADHVKRSVIFAENQFDTNEFLPEASSFNVTAPETKSDWLMKTATVWQYVQNVIGLDVIVERRLTNKTDFFCLQCAQSFVQTPGMLEIHCRSMSHIVNCVHLLHPWTIHEIAQIDAKDPLDKNRLTRQILSTVLKDEPNRSRIRIYAPDGAIGKDNSTTGSGDGNEKGRTAIVPPNVVAVQRIAAAQSVKFFAPTVSSLVNPRPPRPKLSAAPKLFAPPPVRVFPPPSPMMQQEMWQLQIQREALKREHEAMKKDLAKQQEHFQKMLQASVHQFGLVSQEDHTVTDMEIDSRRDETSEDADDYASFHEVGPLTITPGAASRPPSEQLDQMIKDMLRVVEQIPGKSLPKHLNRKIEELQNFRIIGANALIQILCTDVECVTYLCSICHAWFRQQNVFNHLKSVGHRSNMLIHYKLSKKAQEPISRKELDFGCAVIWKEEGSGAVTKRSKHFVRARALKLYLPTEKHPPVIPGHEFGYAATRVYPPAGNYEVSGLGQNSSSKGMLFNQPLMVCSSQTVVAVLKQMKWAKSRVRIGSLSEIKAELPNYSLNLHAVQMLVIGGGEVELIEDGCSPGEVAEQFRGIIHIAHRLWPNLAILIVPPLVSTDGRSLRELRREFDQLREGNVCVALSDDPIYDTYSVIEKDVAWSDDGKLSMQGRLEVGAIIKQFYDDLKEFKAKKPPVLAIEEEDLPLHAHPDPVDVFPPSAMLFNPILGFPDPMRMLNANLPVATISTAPPNRTEYHRAVKVFIGKISPSCPDQLIHDMLKECGMILEWNRPRNTEGQSEAFGYCQFANLDGAKFAFWTLDGFKVGGQRLVVRMDEKLMKLLKKRKQNPEQQKQCDYIRQRFIDLVKVVDPDLILDDLLVESESRSRRKVVFGDRRSPYDEVPRDRPTRFSDPSMGIEEIQRSIEARTSEIEAKERALEAKRIALEEHKSSLDKKRTRQRSKHKGKVDLSPERKRRDSSHSRSPVSRRDQTEHRSTKDEVFKTPVRIYPTQPLEVRMSGKRRYSGSLSDKEDGELSETPPFRHDFSSKQQPGAFASSNSPFEPDSLNKALHYVQANKHRAAQLLRQGPELAMGRSQSNLDRDDRNQFGAYGSAPTAADRNLPAIGGGARMPIDTFGGIAQKPPTIPEVYDVGTRNQGVFEASREQNHPHPMAFGDRRGFQETYETERGVIPGSYASKPMDLERSYRDREMPQTQVYGRGTFAGTENAYETNRQRQQAYAANRSATAGYGTAGNDPGYNQLDRGQSFNTGPIPHGASQTLLLQGINPSEKDMLLQMLLKDREEQRKKEEKQALMGTLAELQTMTGQGGHNLQPSSSGAYAGSGPFGGNIDSRMNYNFTTSGTAPSSIQFGAGAVQGGAPRSYR